MRRLALTFLVLVASSAVLSGTAHAQEDDDPPKQVVLTGRVDVAEGEVVGDVVVFNGPVLIDGTVEGKVVVFNGRLIISGTVDGDVFHVRGGLRIEAGARVTGDVVSRRTPAVSPDAVVEGERRRFGPDAFTGLNLFAARLALWLAATVSTLVLGLLLLLLGPRAAEAVAAVGRARVGASIGWGVLLFFGLPVLAVVAMVTLVGIPFGVGLLLALFLVYSLGYVAGAIVLGRSLVRPPRSGTVAFLAGWGILRILALVPVLGGILWFVSALYGLGVLVVTVWRARTPPALEAGAATVAATPA